MLPYRNFFNPFLNKTRIVLVGLENFGVSTALESQLEKGTNKSRAIRFVVFHLTNTLI